MLVARRLAHLSRSRWRVLALVSLAQLAVAFDQTFVLVALPSIERDLAVPADQLQWVVTGYAVVFGGAVLLGGRLADVVGRRRTLLAGLGLFAAGAVAAALAPTALALVAARAAQGLGVALIGPGAVSTLTTAYVGRQRATALGVWAAVGGAGGALGLVAGGALAQTVGWSAGPLVAAALAAVTAVLVRAALPAGTRSARPLDLAGAALVTTGLSLGVLAISRSASGGWHEDGTRVVAGAALALLLAFALAELRASDPLLPLGFLRTEGVAPANLVAVLLAAAVSSTFVLLTVVLQERVGYSTAGAGLGLAVLSGVSAVSALLVTRVVGSVRPHALVGGALLLVTAGAASLARLPEDASYLRDLLPGLLLIAIGSGTAFVGINTAALASLPEGRAGLGSGLLGTAQQVGAALGIAPLSAVLATDADATEVAAAGADPAVGPAFGVAAALALLAAVAAVALLGRSRTVTALDGQVAGAAAT